MPGSLALPPGELGLRIGERDRAEQSRGEIGRDRARCGPGRVACERHSTATGIGANRARRNQRLIVPTSWNHAGNEAGPPPLAAWRFSVLGRQHHDRNQSRCPLLVAGVPRMGRRDERPEPIVLLGGRGPRRYLRGRPTDQHACPGIVLKVAPPGGRQVRAAKCPNAGTNRAGVGVGLPPMSRSSRTSVARSPRVFGARQGRRAPTRPRPTASRRRGRGRAGRS